MSLIESAVEDAVPWIKYAKGGALLVAFVAWSGLVWYDGLRREESAFEEYKAKAASEQLVIQQKYDAIGGDESKTYHDKLAADLAETKRQLQDLKNAPAPSHSVRRGSHGVKGVAAGNPSDDPSRIIGVLRDAAGGGK